MTKRKYKSAAFAAIHEAAEALHEIGAIDKRTMRDFDKASLAPLPNYTGKQIRKLREREKSPNRSSRTIWRCPRTSSAIGSGISRKPAGPPSGCSPLSKSAALRRWWGEAIGATRCVS